MKKLFTLILFFVTLSTQAQKLSEHVDEFTGHKIKKTSVDYLRESFTFSIAVSIQQINDDYFMVAAINIGTNKYFSISEGTELMFKLENGEVVTLKALESQVSTRGGAYTGRFAGSNAVGLTGKYLLSEENMEAFKRSNVAKIRIYTTDKYYDDEVKSSKADAVKKAVTLIASKN